MNDSFVVAGRHGAGSLHIAHLSFLLANTEGERRRAGSYIYRAAVRAPSA